MLGSERIGTPCPLQEKRSNDGAQTAKSLRKEQCRMTNPAAVSPAPSNEVKFVQVTVPDPGILVASLTATDLDVFLRTPWFQSLYRSSDRGDHWMALNSVNSATDIVAFVVWDAKKKFLSAPAGLQAVVELFFVKGSTLHYAVLSTPEQKHLLKGVNTRAVHDYLQKTVIGAHFGPANAGRLYLNRLETVQDSGRTLLKVWGILRLRHTALITHDPGTFEREAMVFVLEEKDGALELEAFCLNVLAQKVFGRLVRDIRRLRPTISSMLLSAAVATEESIRSGDVDLSVSGSATKRSTTSLLADPIPKLLPLMAAKPPAGVFATDPADERLKKIEPARDRSIIAAWNSGKTAKEIGKESFLSEKTVNNICSKWRKYAKGLVRGGK